MPLNDFVVDVRTDNDRGPATVRRIDVDADEDPACEVITELLALAVEPVVSRSSQRIIAPSLVARPG